jgi:hypothetical protein
MPRFWPPGPVPTDVSILSSIRSCAIDGEPTAIDGTAWDLSWHRWLQDVYDNVRTYMVIQFFTCVTCVSAATLSFGSQVQNVCLLRETWILMKRNECCIWFSIQLVANHF